jgi:NRAMP (natural resistance-associated macrophage protein)-like metal ion transporter
MSTRQSWSTHNDESPDPPPIAEKFEIEERGAQDLAAAGLGSVMGDTQWRSLLVRGRRWLTFIGPSWLISAAYIDPGSIVSDFQQGAYTGYQLLWMTFAATIVGCVFQTLALRLGLVTKKNLAVLCAEYYKSKYTNWTIWLIMEVSTVMVDVQAVVGSAIAVTALTSIPFWASCLIICALTLVIVLFYQWRGNHTELFTGLLVVGLVACFAVNFFQVLPPAGEVFRGWWVATAPPYTEFTALGILGALMMPNVIFLHSDLVIQHKYAQDASVVKVYWSAFGEMMFSMMFAFFGNLMVICVFASVFFDPTCAAQNLALKDGNCTSVLLDDGVAFLAHGYGPVFESFFLVGLIGSGLASMVSSTLAGQCITEGFIKIKLPFWQRLLITRIVTLIPTLLLSVLPGNGSQAASILNEWINVVVSLLLPFALIPVVNFSNKDFMEGWKLHTVLYYAIWAITWTIIFINFYFLVGFIYQPTVFGDGPGSFPDEPWFYSLIGAFLIGYLYLLGLTLQENMVDLRDTAMVLLRKAVVRLKKHRQQQTNEEQQN